VREQVVTTRAGRVGAASKARAGVNVQRPAARRPAAERAPRQRSFAWKSALAYVPAVLKIVLAVSLGVLAFVGYRAAVSASFFKVRAVDVDGAARASRDEIRADVLRLSNAGVWQADLEAIAAELRGLPWVRGAVVSRVLPSGLRVRVTERVPRVIARTAQGRLVWVDDDGVMLGAASPGEQDFFIRGLEEGRTDEALKTNRERVKSALDLSSEWGRAGLSRRVSEVNLEDLRDVRVQLAGEDAAVEVRLGREDLVKRFRQALEVLDAQRQTPRGPFITYVDVSQGKRAIIGTGANARFQLNERGDAESVEPQQQPDASARAALQRGGRASSATAKNGKKEARREKQVEKKGDAARPADVALRPRRVN
jgi:cell division septal protein FtsQ